MDQRKLVIAKLEEELGKYLKLNNLKEEDLTENDWESIRFNLGWTLTHQTAHTANV